MYLSQQYIWDEYIFVFRKWLGSGKLWLVIRVYCEDKMFSKFALEKLFSLQPNPSEISVSGI